MVNDEHYCEGTESVSQDFTGRFFVFVFLLPLSVAICTYVLLRLARVSKTKLTIAVAIYVCCALCFEVLGAYDHVFQFIITRGHRTPIAICATADFFLWFLGGGCYLALQRVFLQRLSVVFENTAFEMQPWLVSLWNAFHVFMCLLATGTLMIRAALKNCFIEREFHGFLASKGVIPRNAWDCDISKRYGYVDTVGVLIMAVGSLCGNSALAWMYSWRLQRVFGGENGLDADDAENKKTVIRKTVTIAMASFLTDFIAFIAASVASFELLYIDVLLNVVFVFCLFSFGKHWYNATLRHCECLVDCLFTDNTQAIELEMASISSKMPSLQKVTSNSVLH